MKSTTTFEDRLARIAAREGHGAELLAGVTEEDGRKPKVKMPKEAKKRRKGGFGVPLVMTAALATGAALYLEMIPALDLETLQAQTAALQGQLASYIE